MTERIKWIDMAKGYGTILVIIGHLAQGFLKNEIYSFHMPLFFFLAGYVFFSEKYKVATFIKNKFRTLIVPYFFMGMVIIVCMWVFHGIFSLADFMDGLSQLLIQKRFQAIWFLACLFFTEMLMFVLIKVLKNNHVLLTVIVLLITGMGFLYYRLGGPALPWNIDICMISVFFFTFGYLMRQCGIFEKTGILKKGIVTLIAVIVLQVICVIINTRLTNERVDMFYNQYACIPITLLASILGILVVIYISNLKANNIILYVGQHSMIYFGWHHALVIPILEIVYRYLGVFQNLENDILYGLYIGISTLIILLCLTIVDMVIRNTKLRVLLGIKKKGDKK